MLQIPGDRKNGWLAVWAARTCNTTGYFWQRDLMFRLCQSKGVGCQNLTSAPVPAQKVNEPDLLLCCETQRCSDVPDSRRVLVLHSKSELSFPKTQRTLSGTLTCHVSRLHGAWVVK
jgi:hypothetical protein